MDVNEDYLWDRSGPADSEVARLEAELAGFRHRGRPPAAARRWPWLRAAAAIVALGLITAILWPDREETGPGPVQSVGTPDMPAGIRVPSPYNATVQAGTARLLGPSNLDATLVAGGEAWVIPVGGRLETAAGSRVELAAAGIGRVTVEDATQLRIDGVSEEQHRFFLDRGRLRASILPPPYVRPRLFQVGTPAGLAVDLGCTYVLDVDAEGSTTLEVTLGAVAFETEGGQVWVSRGYGMKAPKGRPLSPPLAKDSSPEFREAVDLWHQDVATKMDPIETILRLARGADAMTLWHLLGRVSADRRKEVVDALDHLFPMPPGTDPAALLRADPAALASWRRSICGF